MRERRAAVEHQRSDRRVWILWVLMAMAVLAGCTSAARGGADARSSTTAASVRTNAGLSESGYRAAVTAAFAAGSAVHVTGTGNEGGQSLKMDLHLNKDGSGEGTLSIGDAAQPVRAVGGMYYVQMTDSYVRDVVQHGGSAAQYVPLTGKWVSTPINANSEVERDVQLLSYSAVSDQSVGTADGVHIHAAGTTSLDGHTVALYQADSGDRLYVALSGPAYLLRRDFANGGGSLVFAWNQPVTVVAPPAAETVAAPSDPTGSQAPGP
jgi:hypothetical protein